MAKVFTFFGVKVYKPGVYSKILTVGTAAPTPDGTNALVIIAEAINGPAFGIPVTGGNLNDYRLILGDQGPAIEATFGAFNASPSLTLAQDIRVLNPRALVQATETIYVTGPATTPSIDIASEIYGPVGNNVRVVLETLTSTICSVYFPWEADPIQQVIDYPIFDITLAAGGMTIDADKISVGPTGNLVDFTFLEYDTVLGLLTAIENQVSATVVKDTNISDNLSTIGLFDQIAIEADISTITTVQADLNQLFTFLDEGIPLIKATKLSTATVMVDDFDLTLSGGTSGTDPDVVQWGKVYDELENQNIAVTCPIADGLPTPYDDTLTAAVMNLDEQHAVKMSGVAFKGKKRQSFISIHGGYGWSGQSLAFPADADAIVTAKKPHNSEWSLFFGSGLNALNAAGKEYAQLASYFAVRAASMYLGGLASRVLTGQAVTAIKASNPYGGSKSYFNEADGLKLHQASVIIAETNDEGTRIRQLYSTWTQTDDARLQVPSRTRCSALSDNDVARKLETRVRTFQASGFKPANSVMIDYIKSVLDTHINKTINWLTGYGTVTYSQTGIEFQYKVEEQNVPEIAEIGFGITEFTNAS